MMDIVGGRDDVFLYGRDDEFARLSASRSALSVVAGDPGTGKSALLISAAQGGPELKSPVVTVRYRPGALQIALLTALGGAVAHHMSEEGTARRVGRVLSSAAAKVAQHQLRELGGAAIGFLMEVVADRIGQTAGDLVRDFAAEITQSAKSQLQARITTTADPDVISVFLDIAGQIHQYATRPLVLTLDDADRLSDGDFRQLIDLVDAVPDGVRIRVGHSTPDGTASARVLELESMGAATIRLAGLHRDIVAFWLAEENVQQRHLEPLMQVTGGYPLHIDAAIAHLRSGGRLDDSLVDDSFVAQTKLGFSHLEMSLQQACTQLCAFSDPPSVPHLLALLGCTEADWLSIERRLTESRMFATEIEGRSWFHELRRRALWQQVLSKQEREFSARRALESILAEISRVGTAPISMTIDFARLAGATPTFGAGHQSLTELLQLSRQELAIAAAILELVEQQGELPGAVEARGVLSHARAVFGAEGDLISALRKLKESDLIAMAENNNVAIIVPAWGSAATFVALNGRIAAELDRVAVPRLATAIFDSVFRPAIGQFVAAHYGIGEPTITKLSKMLKEMQFDRSNVGNVSRRELHGMLARVEVGGTHMYAAVGLPTAESRDHALAALTKQTFRVAGQIVKVTRAWAWPHPEPLPELRFTNAAALCLGLKMGGPHSSAELMQERRITSMEDELRLRRAAVRTLRQLADATQRAAMAMEEEPGFVFYTTDSAVVVCEVPGFDDVLRVTPLAAPFSTFFAFELAQAAGLRPDHEVKNVTYRGQQDPKNPVAEVLQESYKSMHAFNVSQSTHRQREIRLEATELRDVVLSALDRQSEDAQAMIDAGVLEAVRPPFRALYTIVSPGEENPSWVTGTAGWFIALSVPAVDRNSFQLKILQAHDEVPYSLHSMKEFFDLDDTETRDAVLSISRLIDGLAATLGYDSAYIRLLD